MYDAVRPRTAGPGALLVVAGRLLCDTYLAARDLVREVDYTLTTLARSLLKQERTELSAADVPGGAVVCSVSPLWRFPPTDTPVRTHNHCQQWMTGA